MTTSTYLTLSFAFVYDAKAIEKLSEYTTTICLPWEIKAIFRTTNPFLA